MQSKNSIDMLVRQALEGGQEQLNLGAWANMDRMLDGKNPYAKAEDDDKKRGIFWLFGALLIALGLFGSGTYHYFHKRSIASNKTEKHLATNADKVIKSKANSYASPVVANNSADQTNSNNASNANIENNKASLENIQPISKIANNQSNNTYKIISNTETKNGVSVGNSLSKTNLSNQNIKTTNYTNNLNNNTTINNRMIFAEQNTQLPNIIPSNNYNVNDITSANLVKSEFYKLEKIATINQPILPSYADADHTLAPIKIPDSIFIINKVISSIKTEDGLMEKEKIEYKKVALADAGKPKLVAAENKEEEILQRNYKTAEEFNDKKLVSATPAKKSKKVDGNKGITSNTISENGTNTNIAKSNHTITLANNIATTGKKEEVTKTDAKPKTNASTTNWAQKAMENMVETTKRLGYIKIFNQKLEVNPGVFAGINGSFFNTEHDFGGFQTGTNLMIQIGKNLSLIPHLGFYYRNNGGYGIKDYQTTITNQNVKISTDGLSNIYSYQLDSTRVNYNFKHIYSFEAPILLQYNRRDFGFYGGVNLSYGLKMNTVNNSKSFTEQKEIILPLGAAYAYPGSQSTYYKSTDFQSRFGIGYVVGGSYDFHPNLYVDFRITQNLWDNSGTQSAIEMSKKMFRVPSLQLGIGYRFKERERARY